MTNQNPQTTPRELPTLDGWTIDFRLEEFRRMIPDEECSFVPFDSDAGQELLSRYEATQDERPDK